MFIMILLTTEKSSNSLRSHISVFWGYLWRHTRIFRKFTIIAIFKPTIIVIKIIKIVIIVPSLGNTVRHFDVYFILMISSQEKRKWYHFLANNEVLLYKLKEIKNKIV